MGGGGRAGIEMGENEIKGMWENWNLCTNGETIKQSPNFGGPSKVKDRITRSSSSSTLGQYSEPLNSRSRSDICILESLHFYSRDQKAEIMEVSVKD